MDTARERFGEAYFTRGVAVNGLGRQFHKLR